VPEKKPETLTDTANYVPRIAFVEQETTAGHQQCKYLLKQPSCVALIEQIMRYDKIETAPLENSRQIIGWREIRRMGGRRAGRLASGWKVTAVNGIRPSSLCPAVGWKARRRSRVSRMLCPGSKVHDVAKSLRSPKHCGRQ